MGHKTLDNNQESTFERFKDFGSENPEIARYFTADLIREHGKDAALEAAQLTSG